MPGVTKESFDTGNEMYYLTYDGKWINQHHEPVDVTEALLRMSKGVKPNERQYYVLRSMAGHTYYVNRLGDTYLNAMPGADGPTEEQIAKAKGPKLNPFIEQGEDPRKEAKEYIVNAESGPGVRRFYRYPDGTFTDEEGKVVAAEIVVPKISRHKAEATVDGKKQELLGVETRDGKIAYYNVKGEQVPAEVEPEPQVKDEPEIPPAPKAPPTASELILAGNIDATYQVGLQEYIYRTKDNKWIDFNGNELKREALAKIIDSEKYAGFYKVSDINRVTKYIDERDGSVHDGIEIVGGETIAARYARLKQEENKKNA